MWLFAKNLLFTVLVPGTVAVLVPCRLLPRDAELSLRGLRPFGLVLILGGAVAYFWCLWHFAGTGRGTPAPIDPPKALVAKGLYRIVRNPMYVGVLAVIFGEAILFDSRRLFWYGFWVALGFHVMVVAFEEPALRSAFGPAYEEYRRAVPRWIPRRSRGPR
jgi:protein-S-isoprenylcysteine O-methyltransferase Ste14